MLSYLCSRCHLKLLTRLGQRSALFAGDNRCNGRRLSVVFYGSDEFSLETLRVLYQDFRPQQQSPKTQSLITRLDVVLNSKSNIVSRFAAQNQLTTHLFPYELPDNTYDLGIVSSFGHLIPKRTISACRLGMLNIHGSLLPRWRGAAPVNYAVLHNDPITGVTIMRIKPKKFDVGDIVLQTELQIPSRITAHQLKALLAPIGAQLLWKCLLNLENNLNNCKSQPNEGITYAPKFDETYGLIDWSTMTATDIDRRFRAFVDFIDIYTHWTDGTRLKLYDIVDPEVVATLQLNRLSGCPKPTPGFMYYHKKRRILCVSCADGTWSAFGSLALKGHKHMSALQFNNGFIKRYNNEVILGQRLQSI